MHALVPSLETALAVAYVHGETLSRSTGASQFDVAIVALYTYNNMDHPESVQFYAVVNRQLRRFQLAADEERRLIIQTWYPYVDALCTAIQKCTRIRMTRVWRGITQPMRVTMGMYAIGASVTFTAFTSTSTSFYQAWSTALRFRYASHGDYDITMLGIDIQEGYNVAAWSFFPSESEVILLPHAKFVVANSCMMTSQQAKVIQQSRGMFAYIKVQIVVFNMLGCVVLCSYCCVSSFRLWFVS